jgi:FkbM family methyltransferase
MKFIRERLTTLSHFLRGRITLTQVLSSMLPARLRSPSVGTLFGKPFIIADGNIFVFLELQRQVISSNQYHIELIKGDVIDAGANVGIFSIFAAIKYPNATIYSFEPNPSTFKALKENTKHYPNIRVFNYGLGEKNKMASIIPTSSYAESYIGEGGIPVEVKTLDSFSFTAGFIKMDTEGYEANILKGAVETIRKNKPIIVMASYHKPNDKTELPVLLNSIAPYDCELHHDAEEDLVCKPIKA